MKYYMQAQSGDVATEEDWKDDFENMDLESWYGCEAKDANLDRWIEGGNLIEVERVEGEWIEV